jgi:branched-chain amino acid transport system ATP-binding protein
VVLVPDFRALFTGLTPVQNLQLAARRGGPTTDEVLDLFPALRRRARLRTGDLSGGEQQMLAVGQVANESQASVILVEQHVQLALEIADRAAVLVHGDVVVSGAAADLRQDGRALEAAYLGSSPARPASS